MPVEERFTLESESVGALPVVNWFLARMGVFVRLDRFLPHDDARLRLAPATVIGVALRNIIVGHRPVYALGEWAAPIDTGLLGLSPGEAAALNDDRVGRMLDRLFDADRATLITETVLSVVREFQVELGQLHNDSTTITLTGGDYPGGGEERSGKPVVKPAFGHNKDFRPDLRQLLFVLTVSGDGAVPVAYRVLDGNTSDDTTHIPTWDELVTLVGDPRFLYVADSKLCSKEAMGHIASRKGRFVTVIPHGRKEDRWFRDWAQSHAPAWQEADRRGGARLGDPDEVWRTFEAPAPSTDGYRVVWVHSSGKAARDAASRAARIEAGLAAVEEVQARLQSPKTRLKTKVAAEEAVKAALAATGAGRWVGFTVAESTVTDYRQEKRGRPGSATRYRRTDKAVFSVVAEINAELVSYDAATDGCFPLITNDREMTPEAVLAAYRYQPNLERRNHMLKGPQLVAPVFLESPHRIEALLLGASGFSVGEFTERLFVAPYSTRGDRGRLAGNQGAARTAWSAVHLHDQTREHAGHAAVKAMPCGWPAASLDRSSGKLSPVVLGGQQVRWPQDRVPPLPLCDQGYPRKTRKRLLLCHFLAMLAEALIEREARVSMKAKSLAGIPLYPELRNCPAPSAPRILEILSGVQRHRLMRGDDVVQVFEPQLTSLQLKVLDLLHVPAAAYASVAAL